MWLAATYMSLGVTTQKYNTLQTECDEHINYYIHQNWETERENAILIKENLKTKNECANMSNKLKKLQIQNDLLKQQLKRKRPRRATMNQFVK